MAVPGNVLSVSVSIQLLLSPDRRQVCQAAFRLLLICFQPDRSDGSELF